MRQIMYSSGNWHNIAFTVAPILSCEYSATVTLYLDGVCLIAPVQSISEQALCSSAADLVFGAGMGGTGGHVVGSVDEVALLDRHAKLAG